MVRAAVALSMICSRGGRAVDDLFFDLFYFVGRRVVQAVEVIRVIVRRVGTAKVTTDVKIGGQRGTTRRFSRRSRRRLSDR